MDFNIWLAYFITGFLLAVTPGPAVLLIVSQGLKYGSMTSNFGALGISLANLFYFILSALGLGAIIIEAGHAFEIIKVLGAIYLVVVGTKMFFASFGKRSSELAVAEVNVKSYKNAFATAFITQISNLKAIIFFVALLPQFISPSGNILLQFFILALTTILMETLILICYGWPSATAASRLKDNKKVMAWIDRIGGGVLVGIGINLFLLKGNK